MISHHFPIILDPSGGSQFLFPRFKGEPLNGKGGWRFWNGKSGIGSLKRTGDFRFLRLWKWAKLWCNMICVFFSQQILLDKMVTRQLGWWICHEWTNVCSCHPNWLTGFYSWHEKVERNALENQVDLIPQRLNTSISMAHWSVLSQYRHYFWPDNLVVCELRLFSQLFLQAQPILTSLWTSGPALISNVAQQNSTSSKCQRGGPRFVWKIQNFQHLRFLLLAFFFADATWQYIVYT